jgi:hypothetical protein
MIDNIQKVNKPNRYMPGKDLLELTYHYRAQTVASTEKLITELNIGTQRYYLFTDWLWQYRLSTCI